MNNQKKKLNEEAQRLQEAGDWFVLLRQEEISSAERAAWLEWSRSDTRNLEAFERIRDLSFKLDGLDREQKSALIRDCLSEQPPASGSAAPRRRSLFYVLAASIAIVAITASYFALRLQARYATFRATYATVKAQNRKFALPDGTRIELGARSKIHLSYTPHARSVQLRAGEAYFQVKHDARRPFTVWAGRLWVKDVGTAFDVRKNKDRIVVSVADGVVNVAKNRQKAMSAVSSGTVSVSQSVQVGAGRQASLDASAPTLAVATIDRHAIASWRHGRLKFQNEPLSAVIANINRYSKHEIAIADPAVGKMRFTGTVFQHRIKAWLTATEQVFALRQERGQQGRVLLYVKKRSK